jgi:hypothetical protein
MKRIAQLILVAVMPVMFLSACHSGNSAANLSAGDQARVDADGMAAELANHHFVFVYNPVADSEVAISHMQLSEAAVVRDLLVSFRTRMQDFLAYNANNGTPLIASDGHRARQSLRIAKELIDMVESHFTSLGRPVVVGQGFPPVVPAHPIVRPHGHDRDRFHRIDKDKGHGLDNNRPDRNDNHDHDHDRADNNTNWPKPDRPRN